MTVLVCGGTGFLGSALVRHLTYIGEPLALLKSYRTVSEPLVSWPALGVVKAVSSAEFCSQFSGVIHLGERNTYSGHLDLQDRVETADFLLSLRLPRYLYVSSATVYGPGSRQPLREDAPLHPVGEYAKHKATVEKKFQDAQSAIIVRPTTIFGFRKNPADLVSRLIIELLGGTSPIAVKNSSTVRDFIFVEDVARAISAAFLSGKTGVLNIGSGQPKSVTEVVSSIARIIGCSPELKSSGAYFDYLTVDTRRMTEVVNLEDFVGFAQGIIRTVDAYSKG